MFHLVVGHNYDIYVLIVYDSYIITVYIYIYLRVYLVGGFNQYMKNMKVISHLG